MSWLNKMFQLTLLLTVPNLADQNRHITEGNHGLKRASYENGVSSYAHFVAHKNQYLQGSLLDSSLEVDKPSECTLACLNNLPCFSFNLAFLPNEKRKLRCELLTGDKYRNPNKLVVSQRFHHYSIKVICASVRLE